MKLSNKTRLKKLEIKIGYSKKRPLSISYVSKNSMLYIKHINCDINEFFNWNGVILLIPDNGRRVFEDFFLTSEYAKKQTQIFEILTGIAEEKNLKLAIDIPNSKSDYDEE